MQAGIVGWFERNPAGARRLKWVVVAIVLAVSAAVGIRRADATRFDFKCFYLEAAAIAGGRDLTESDWLEWYLPGFRIAIAPLHHLGPRGAAVVWNIFNVAAAVVSIWALTRCAARPSSARGVAEFAVFVAFLLAGPLIFYNFQCNQISLWVLALLSLAGLAALRQRQAAVGVWLGLAIFVKVIPGLLVGWCLLRRRFVAAAIAAALPIVLSLSIDAAASGTSSAWRHHAHWSRVCASGGAGSAFLDGGRNLRHQNQGLGAILARLLQPQEPDMASPLSPETDRQLRSVNIASLSTGAVRHIYQAVIVLSVISLVVVTIRTPKDATGELGLFAIWCIAIIWFAPLARQYYEVWALPALCFLADRWLRNRAENRSLAVCTAATIAWLVGLVGWAVPELRAIGMNQWVNLAIMAAIATEVFATAASPSAPVLPRR